VPSLG
jgi:hypothetical protein